MTLSASQIANQYRRCGMTPPEELIRGAAAKMAQMGSALSEVASPKAKRGMNGLERQYAEHLDLQKRFGAVTWWAYEPVRLRLADGAFFKPDFLVQFAHGDSRMTCVDTKGFSREASRVRIKVAAELFPIFRFLVVKKIDGGWREEKIG